MRIISGSHGGRLLHPPKNLPVRPTTDFAKTGLFNILQHRFNFHRLSVLDLYAGTGALAYEFFSRGCTRVTAVDIHPGCIRFIQQTLRTWGAPSTCEAVCTDALRFLQTTTQTYDIILADAPFAITPAAALTEVVFGRKLLHPGGWLIIEHESKNPPEGLEKKRETRKYGNVSFSFFEAE